MKTVTEIVQAAEQASAQQREAAYEALLGENRKLEIEPYVTLRSVAKRTGVSVTSLWRLKVPGHQLGGRRRFKLSEVARYLEELSNTRETSEVSSCKGPQEPNVPSAPRKQMCAGTVRVGNGVGRSA